MRENKAGNGFPRTFRISSGVLVTIALILIVGAAILFLLQSGILTGEDPSDDTTDETADLLSVLETEAETDVVFWSGSDLEANELLETLSEAEAVVRNYRAVEAWENSYTVERTTAAKLGNKYRIESESRLIICDGETVYRREGIVEMTLDAAQTDFYAEAGLTPLTAIQAVPPEQISASSYDNPKNKKYIRMTVNDGSYRTEYEISIETGIPVTERSYLGNAVYRMILTDSVSIFAIHELPEDTFEIPDYK